VCVCVLDYYCVCVLLLCIINEASSIIDNEKEDQWHYDGPMTQWPMCVCVCVCVCVLLKEDEGRKVLLVMTSIVLMTNYWLLILLLLLLILLLLLLILLLLILMVILLCNYYCVCVKMIVIM